MSKKTTDFNKLKNIKKPTVTSESQGFGYFTVRLSKKDANHLKYLFSENSHTIQSALVESLNTQLEKWGESKRVADIGTGAKSSKETD